MSPEDQSQQDQNSRDIAANTQEIAQNTEDIRSNLSTLNAGGEERWKHIHATEQDVKENARSIHILDEVKIKGVQFKINILALFAFLMLIMIAFLLQQQAADFDAELTDQCRFSQVQARAYNENVPADKPNAKIEIPVCNS